MYIIDLYFVLSQRCIFTVDCSRLLLHAPAPSPTLPIIPLPPPISKWHVFMQMCTCRRVTDWQFDESDSVQLRIMIILYMLCVIVAMTDLVLGRDATKYIFLYLTRPTSWHIILSFLQKASLLPPSLSTTAMIFFFFFWMAVCKINRLGNSPRISFFFLGEKFIFLSKRVKLRSLLVP